MDYNLLTLAELQKLAKEENIKRVTGIKKQDLIAVLEETLKKKKAAQEKETPAAKPATRTRTKAVKAEEDEKAEKEIKSLQIRRTMGGTICEFITLIMLIVSWMLIFHKQLFADADASIFKINILFTIGAIWFLVTAYFHKVMGFKPTTTKQLQLGIYRKRALAIGCAIFLIIGTLFPHTELSKAAEGLLFAFALSLLLIFASKFFINLIKK